MSQIDDPIHQQFSRNELRAMVEEARYHGCPRSRCPHHRTRDVPR
jgi:imidazolonepropionase-like amidohydrolase